MTLAVTAREREFPVPRGAETKIGTALRSAGLQPLCNCAAEFCAQLALGDSKVLEACGVKRQTGDLVFMDDLVLFYSTAESYVERSLFSTSPTLIVRAGGIHDCQKNIGPILVKFCSIIADALYRPGPPFLEDWIDVPWVPENDRFQKLVFSSKQEPQKTSLQAPPGHGSKESSAVKVLADPQIRQLAMQVKTSSSVLSVTKADDSMQSCTEALVRAGLAETKLVVTCRKFNDRRVLVLDPTEIEATAGKCPHCGRSIRDEFLTSALAPTELCFTLLDSSGWMVQHVCNVLNSLGIESDHILSNKTIADEEIDLVIDLYGDLVIAELKDRVFGLNDARTLIDRCLRLAADGVVVVTTCSIAPEARNRLNEFRNSRLGQQGKVTSIVMVEGLPQLEPELRSLVGRTNWRAVAKVLDNITTNLPVIPLNLVALKFGMTAESMCESN